MKSTRQRSIIVILALIFGLLIFAPMPATADEIIIDNGDTGTTPFGLWAPSGGPNSYGRTSVFNKTKEGGTYSFEADVSGSCDVSLRWTYFNNRYTSVPVEIYDGTMLLDMVYVNQLENAGRWNQLGTYDFNGTAKVVIHSVGGEFLSTCADGVRFVTESPGPRCPSFPRPCYDSGWINAEEGGQPQHVLYHRIGGNSDDYIVDLTERRDTYSNGKWNVNIMRMGQEHTSPWNGAYWCWLDEERIVVHYPSWLPWREQFRVRIWKY